MHTAKDHSAVQAHDHICTECWSNAKDTITASSLVGKSCVLCHVALPHRARSHHVIAMRMDTQHYKNIRNIITEKILPLEVQASHYICHPCWQRADRAAKQYTRPSTSNSTARGSTQLKCVNCGINVTRMKRHILNDEIILHHIQQRVAPKMVTASDYICDACHLLFHNDNPVSEDYDSVGHRNVCIKCGYSVRGLRHYKVLNENHEHILSVVQNWIYPQEVQSADVICHRCFQKAEADFRTNALLPYNTSAQSEIIILPNYRRAPHTHARCIFPSCNSKSQQLVPDVIRVRLFSDHKYYISPGCRICRFHLESQSWSLLFEADNTQHSFSATQIEDFCELLKQNKNEDFENI
ncbi:uncharacterized protein LOC115445672 isoform X2 [Manduca sexta]|uniref:uncharacterized protein LOC115445672 isoform X2 n=1 Tax=Manduca sexta TaxID=7130 RepID=UPI0011828747|nr:uncharacterized protein LOC115445672 isoform X2 [Manduca sexta]